MILDIGRIVLAVSGIRREKKVVRHLRKHGVVAAATAVRADELQSALSFDVRDACAGLRSKRILVEAADGRLFLDDQRNTQVNRQIAYMLSAAAGLVAVMVIASMNEGAGI